MKIKVKLKDNTFKVGDYVRVIQDTNELGKIGRLYSIRSKNSTTTYWNVEGLEHPYAEGHQIVKI